VKKAKHFSEDSTLQRSRVEIYVRKHDDTPATIPTSEEIESMKNSPDIASVPADIKGYPPIFIFPSLHS